MIFESIAADVYSKLVILRRLWTFFLSVGAGISRIVLPFRGLASSEQVPHVLDFLCFGSVAGEQSVFHHGLSSLHHR